MNPDDIPTTEIDVSAFRKPPPDREQIEGTLGRAITATEQAGGQLLVAAALMRDAMRLIGEFFDAA